MLQVLCPALEAQFHFRMKDVKSQHAVTSEKRREPPDVFWILVFLLVLLCVCFFLFCFSFVCLK